MPIGPVLAEAITATAVPAYSLFIGGVDVLKQAGGYGVPLESIEVIEAGPGGVSSMTFTIEDPAKNVSIPNPIDVTFIDNATEKVFFRGFTDRATPHPDFGGQGRTIEVECSGLEILLDWMIVPAGFIPSSAATTNTLQPQVGLMVSLFAPMIRAPVGPPFYTDPNYTRNGSFLYPVGTMARTATIVAIRNQVGGAPISGGTIRNMIIEMLQDAVWIESAVGIDPIEYGVKALYTVDFYYGLRSWEDAPTLQPDDYTTLTITDTYAGPNRAAGLGVQVDWSGVIRSVSVAGTGGTVYGPFSDGSGIIGKGAIVNDTTIANVSVASSRAAGVMAASAAFSRGSFRLEDWTPPTTVHAGSLVSITDAATDVATTYRIGEIRKAFHGSGRQDWEVTFGTLPPPSAAREIKRLVNPPRGRGAPG